MPGPPPKPTALRIVQGNPSKRRLNRNEPRFSGAPTCPTWLTKVAKAEWRRVIAELAALDMLRSVDSSALAAYCQSYARWKQAEQIVDLEGPTVSEPILNKIGEIVGYKVKRNPATTVSKEALASMLRASALFGFDPSSRSRLSVGEQNTSDPFEEFMRGMGADEETHAPNDPIPR